jgi:hypothetical protein
MKYLKELNKTQVYWLAVGSNQHVYNKDNGSFIDKAKTAYSDLDDCDTDKKKYTALKKVFGTDFPDATIQDSHSQLAGEYRDTEEFIENYVPVVIRYFLRIDCKVQQDGFRDFFLSVFLRDGGILRRRKSLSFFIQNNTAPEPYFVWWKVCNVGEEAKRRDCIRGEIVRKSNNSKLEHTDFCGSHFVECYIIKDGVCVARDRIEVPIGTV